MLAADSPLPWTGVVVSLLSALVVCMAVAAVYVWTYQGLSYSRTFVQALVLGGIMAAALMLAIGNNVARGVGILGTLAVIRFRSTMKDPRDLIYLFAAMGLGIAMGVRAYAVGLTAGIMFCGVSWLMTFTAFGSRQPYDGLVRFELPGDPDRESALRKVLEKHCSRWVLVSLREVAQGEAVEHNYHVKLKEPSSRTPFVRELEAIPGSKGVSFFWQEATMDM